MRQMDNAPIDALVHPPPNWGPSSAARLGALDSGWFGILIDTYDYLIAASLTFFPGSWLEAGSGTVHNERRLKPSCRKAATPNRSELRSIRKHSLPNRLRWIFLLELSCRFVDTGCFYVTNSHRFEDPDKRHLAQFIHIEAELPGWLRCCYVTRPTAHVRHLANALLSDAAPALAQVLSSVGHLEAMAKGSGTLPQMSFAECSTLLQDDDRFVPELAEGVRTLSPEGESELLLRTELEALLGHSLGSKSGTILPGCSFTRYERSTEWRSIIKGRRRGRFFRGSTACNR